MFITTVYSLLFSLLDFLGGSSLNQAVLFESLESKTAQNKEVFNIISFKQSDNLDIWKMQQSHNGVHSENWDEIKIIVDKTVKPYQVSYHQIDNGVEVEYKAQCLKCHASGPRLIRPNKVSQTAKLNLTQKLTIYKWNALIKSYGDTKLKRNNSIKRVLKLEQKKQFLDVKTCNHCHYRNGPRSQISVTQKLTMEFLLKNKQMPPWPYSLSKDERNKLNLFLYNF